MLFLFFIVVSSWFAGLHMGLTWGTGAVQWLWRKTFGRFRRVTRGVA